MKPHKIDSNSGSLSNTVCIFFQSTLTKLHKSGAYNQHKRVNLPEILTRELKTSEHNHSMSNLDLFLFLHPNELNFCMWSPIS